MAIDYVQSGTTIIVGSLAYIIYRIKLSDNKRNAAKIILVEISGAEDLIQALKIRFAESDEQDIGSRLVIPSQSWNKYKHLFIDDFTSKQWRKIGEFYDKCKTLNEAIATNDSFFGQNSQALRTERYKAAATFVRAALENVEQGKFSVAQPDGTNILPDNAEKQIGELISSQIKAFNIFLQDATNASGTHYNPVKPINDTNNMLKHMKTEILDGEIGIKLRKIARHKV